MFIFDFLCATFALILLFKVRPFTGGEVVAIQFIIQFMFDVIFIDLGLHEIVASRWFYITKGFIIFLSLYSLNRYYPPSWISLLLFLTMIYYYGLWGEEITFTYRTGLFNKWFLPYMTSNSLLQIIFLIGTTDVGLFARARSRRFFNWRGNDSSIIARVSLLNSHSRETKR